MQFKDATERIGRQNQTGWSSFGQDGDCQLKEQSPYFSSSNEEHSDKDFPEQLVCLRCRRTQIGYLLVVHIVVGLLRQQIMCLSIVDETNCPGRIYESFQRPWYQMSSIWKVSANILLYETWDSTNLISHVSDTT